MAVKEDLVAEINRTMETLGAIELTDEQYSEAANNVTKLVAKIIDLEKIETDREKIKLEREKFDKEQSKVKDELTINHMRATADLDKVGVEREKLEVEREKLKADCEIKNRQDKDAKVDRWINIGVTAGLGLLALGVQIVFNHSSMKYEVTGHYPTTGVGRNSQNKLLNWKF